MKSWETKKGGRTCYVQVTPYEVVVGSHSGSGHSDNAATCSHQELLDGTHQGTIRHEHGDRILQEVIAAVVASFEDPETLLRWTEEHAQAERWKALPTDERLRAFLEDPEERGISSYGKGEGPFVSFLTLGSVSLRVDGSHAVFTVPGRPPREHTLPGNHSALLVAGTRFYVAAQHALIFDAFGDLVASTGPYEESLALARRLRISDVLRRGDEAVFLYRNFANEGAPVDEVVGREGALRLDPDTAEPSWLPRN